MFDYKNRIRELRESNGYSQRLIAELLGTSQRAYSFYETGGREISIDFLNRLADYYHVSTDYILGRTDTKEPYPKSDPTVSFSTSTSNEG